MSHYDSEIAQIEHDLEVLGRKPANLKNLAKLRELRGKAFDLEMRILTPKEDAGFNFALQSIMGQEESIRCRLCNKLLRGSEFRTRVCAACQTDDTI